ncbi:hypothetical protein IWX48DRAFT_179644 [Phyllosticta citricarpa]
MQMPALTLMHARLEGHNVIHLLQQTGILRPRQLHVALRMAVRIVSGRTCSGSKYQGAYSPALRACTPLCPHTLHQSLVSQCRLEQQTHARAAALRLTQPFNQKQSSDWTGDDESARSHAFGRCGQREVGRGRGQKRGVSGLQMRRNLQRCCCCCCCCCTRQNCRQEASSGHGAQHQHCPMSGVSLRAQNQVLAKFMSRCEGPSAHRFPRRQSFLSSLTATCCPFKVFVNLGPVLCFSSCRSRKTRFTFQSCPSHLKP